MKTLVLTPNPPWPPTTGGRQRPALLIRSLARLGSVQTIVVSHDDVTDDPQVAATLARDFGVVDVVRPGRPAERWPWRLLPGGLVRKRVRDRWATRWAGVAHVLAADPKSAARVAAHVRDARPDLVVAYGAPVLAASGLDRLAGRPPVWLDVDDVPTVVAAEAHAPRRPPRARTLARRQHRLLSAAAVLSVSKAADLEAATGLAQALVLPNLPWALATDDPPPAPTPPPGTAHLVSVATMSWPAHTEGVAWFLDTVWPRVLALRPDATIDLVGTPPAPELAQAWRRRAGVRHVGAVEEVATAYAQADLAVVVARRGGGSCLKTPEAFVHGRTCVTTSVGWRGWHEVLPRGSTLRVADDPGEFAAAVVDLLAHPETAHRLAAAGRTAVLEALSFERFASIAAEAAARALAGFGRGQT